LVAGLAQRRPVELAGTDRPDLTAASASGVAAAPGTRQAYPKAVRPVLARETRPSAVGAAWVDDIDAAETAQLGDQPGYVDWGRGRAGGQPVRLFGQVRDDLPVAAGMPGDLPGQLVAGAG
jgi:hypothetical protein